MKKRGLLLLVIMVLGTLICACGQKKEEEVEEIDKSQAIFFYNDVDTGLMCMGDEGTVYTTNQERNEFCEYNVQGDCVETYAVGKNDFIASFCYLDGKLYYINVDKLYEMDLSKGKSKMIYQFDGDDFTFERMVGLEDSVFIMRKNQFMEDQMDVRYDEDDEYIYEGEELLCFHPSSGELEKPDIANIKLFNRKNEKELLIYAYDEDAGFYFITYNVDGTLGKKQYTDMQLGWIKDIAYDTKLDMIACTDNHGVYLTSFEDFSSKSYIYENMSIGYNTLLQQNGMLYDLFRVDGVQKMIRLYGNGLMAKNTVLKAYTLNKHYNPLNYGYQIDCEDVSEDEMALILQAGDSDWDFLVVDTGHQIAKDIQRTGAYYPLNSVEGVERMLDSTYSYVKEAATGEDGDVWMLPYALSCPIMIYNENLQEKYDVDFANLESYVPLFELAESLPTTGTPEYSFLFTLMKTDIMNKYIRHYAIQDNKADFHNEIYRTYMELIKIYDLQLYEGKTVFQTDMTSSHSSEEAERYANILVTMERSEDVQKYCESYTKYDYFRAAAMPALAAGEDVKSEVMAWSVVVNPNSKNLKWVLQYLEELCNGSCEDNSSFMIADNDFSATPLWKDVHEILADGVIYFQYPYDIISDELYRYSIEGQSYEDTVSEMERKMNMYLNE